MNTKNRSILITGAGSGIGLATAKLFASHGWTVGMIDLNAGALEQAKDEVGDNAFTYALDVTNSDTQKAAVDDFAAKAGGINALFNSVGVVDMHVFEETSLKSMRQQIDINFTSVVECIAAAYPHLKEQDESTIVTMSSGSAVYGFPELAVYSGTKFAIRGLTEALNIEFRKSNVWVCDVMVGYVGTPMIVGADYQANSVSAMGISTTAEEVAETIWNSVNTRKVHWFVTEAVEEFATAVDELPWEERTEYVREIAGFE